MIFAVMVGSSARVSDLVEWLLGMAGALLLALEATDPELPLSTLFDDLEARLR